MDIIQRGLESLICAGHEGWQATGIFRCRCCNFFFRLAGPSRLLGFGLCRTIFIAGFSGVATAIAFVQNDFRRCIDEVRLWTFAVDGIVGLGVLIGATIFLIGTVGLGVAIVATSATTPTTLFLIGTIAVIAVFATFAAGFAGSLLFFARLLLSCLSGCN